MVHQSQRGRRSTDISEAKARRHDEWLALRAAHAAAQLEETRAHAAVIKKFGSIEQASRDGDASDDVLAAWEAAKSRTEAAWMHLHRVAQIRA
jgi:hypothetical protein